MGVVLLIGIVFVFLRNFFFLGAIFVSGVYLRCLVKIGGVSNTILLNTTALINGDYFYWYIKSDGTNYTANINGVSQSFTGTDDGNWLADVTGRDSLTLFTYHSSVVAYSPSKFNKLLYSNAAISDETIDNVMEYLSYPTN